MVQELTDQIQVPKTGDGKSSILSPLADHQSARAAFKAFGSGGAGDAAMLQSHGFPDAGDVFSKRGEAHEAPLDKQLRDREVKRLGGEDQKKYHQEEAARQQHQIGTWLDKAQPSPVHDKVDQAVNKAEEQAKKKALDSMTPNERTQLGREEQEYDKKMAENNPGGRGKTLKGIVSGDPKPGPMMEEYERRVAKEANKDLRDNPK